MAEKEVILLPYLLDEQAACAAGAAALSAAGCRRWGGPPLPGPASTREWPPLAAELARVPRLGGFGERNNLLNELQLKATGVNGVGEMQHGAPAYSQPKALERHSEDAPMIDGMVKNTVSEDDVHSTVRLNCGAWPCDSREPTASGDRFHTGEGPHAGVLRVIGGAVRNMFPEDLVHNIVKSNHEALPCDLREPFPRDEGLHTEFARKIDGTVEDAVPEDLVHSILKSKGEALPCDWMEPILRDGGLRTDVVRVIGGTCRTRSRRTRFTAPRCSMVNHGSGA